MKTKFNLTSVLLISSLFASSCLAEEAKMGYQTTPPKNVSIATSPLLAAPVKNNLAALGTIEQDDSLNKQVELQPVVAQDPEEYACPILADLSNHGSSNVIAIRLNQFQFAGEENSRSILRVSVASSVGVDSGEITRWEVKLLDDRGCTYYLQQDELTDALRLMETLQTASFDPNQTSKVELTGCWSHQGDRGCMARFRSLAWESR